MKTIEFYLRSGQVVRDKSIISKANTFLKKARNNLVTLDLLSKLNDSKKARDLLEIPKDYDSNEWVVITGYYAMYASALALLAKIGFRSKNHTATLLVLDEFLEAFRVYYHQKDAQFCGRGGVPSFLAGHR